MRGTLIYWALQVAIWGWCIYFLVTRKEREARREIADGSKARRKTSTAQWVAMMVIVPVIAFLYACMRGFPPKDDQVTFIIIATCGMSGALYLRWRRQRREETE
jgi:hypothetical protein